MAPPSKTETQSGFGIRALLALLISLLTAAACGVSGLSLYHLGRQQSDGKVINIAGRQRMLSQKMTKEVLAIAQAPDNTTLRQTLQKTRDLFALSHAGILQGDDAQGLPPLTDAVILEQMQKVDRHWKEFDVALQKIMASQPADPAVKDALTTVMAVNVQLLEEMNKAVTLFEKASQDKIAGLKAILYLGFFLALAVAIFSFYVVTVRVVRPIAGIVAMIQNLGQGRLGSRIKSTRHDELGAIARSLDHFADSMEHEILTAFQRLATGDFTFTAQGLIREPLSQANQALNQTMCQIQQVAEKISIGSEKMADTSHSLSQSATQSAASTEEIAASMAELNSQTRHNAANADAANRLAETAMHVAERGNTQMNDMNQAMVEINSSSESISRIIKVIDEIAFQTNLLALNAAVEAARAGQHGKGFAVVAEEVRNLAARSAKAAQETSQLIECSVDTARKGADFSTKTAAALNEIVTGVAKVKDLVAEIARASNEQAQGIEQINLGLTQIDQATQMNTATAEQAATSSEELAHEAAHMQEMLSRFKLGAADQNNTAAPQTMQSKPPVTLSLEPQPLSTTRVKEHSGEKKFIRWSDELSVGVQSIDQQHQRLIEMVNELHQALVHAKAAAVIEKIIDGLVEYTVTHFKDEERLIGRHGYPQLDSHKELHAKLIAQVHAFKDRLQQGMPMSAFAGELLSFLRDWLVNHIKKIDKQYGPYLNERGVR